MSLGAALKDTLTGAVETESKPLDQAAGSPVKNARYMSMWP